jgi:hypothetical protein
MTIIVTPFPSALEASLDVLAPKEYAMGDQGTNL